MAITVEDIKPSGLRERNTKGTARVPQIERELDVLLCLRACCTTIAVSCPLVSRNDENNMPVFLRIRLVALRSSPPRPETSRCHRILGISAESCDISIVLNTVRLDTSRDAEDILRCACCQDTSSPNTYIFLTRPRPRESFETAAFVADAIPRHKLPRTYPRQLSPCLPSRGYHFTLFIAPLSFHAVVRRKKAFRLFLPFSSRPSASPGRPRLGMSYLES